MKNKTLLVSILAVFSVAVFLSYSGQGLYARADDLEDDERSIESTESAKPTKTAEVRASRSPEQSASVSPIISSSVSPLSKSRNASEQEAKAIEKINEAQSKLNELKLKLVKEVITVPQNVRTLADLADQKITEAKKALDDQDFGKALGQAQSAESLVKNALRTLENEQEAEGVRSDLEQEIEDEDIASIEIDTNDDESGSLKIEHKDKTRTTRSVSFSLTPLFEIETEDGTIGAHIASGSRVVIDNDDIDIESDFPLTLNVASKTFSVKTTQGVQEIKVLPAKSFAQINKKDKPDSLEKVSLTMEGDKLVFQADGSRSGKIFGFIPLTISIKTVVDAQNGEIVSVDKPWFISLLGPLFR